MANTSDKMLRTGILSDGVTMIALILTFTQRKQRSEAIVRCQSGKRMLAKPTVLL
jgi:hypothetical protein